METVTDLLVSPTFSQAYNLSRALVHRRFKRLGWTPEDAGHATIAAMLRDHTYTLTRRRFGQNEDIRYGDCIPYKPISDAPGTLIRIYMDVDPLLNDRLNAIKSRTRVEQLDDGKPISTYDGEIARYLAGAIVMTGMLLCRSKLNPITLKKYSVHTQPQKP